MGMFDYIRCKMPLPAIPAPPNIEWFQTKDVAKDPYMEQYTIEEDGRLIYRKPEYSWEPDETKEGLMQLAGALKTKSVEFVELPFHRDIWFYEYNTETCERWVYAARFTEGRCVRIWLYEHSPAAESGG